MTPILVWHFPKEGYPARWCALHRLYVFYGFRCPSCRGSNA